MCYFCLHALLCSAPDTSTFTGKTSLDFPRVTTLFRQLQLATELFLRTHSFASCTSPFRQLAHRNPCTTTVGPVSFWAMTQAERRRTFATILRTERSAIYPSRTEPVHPGTWTSGSWMAPGTYAFHRGCGECCARTRRISRLAAYRSEMHIEIAWSPVSQLVSWTEVTDLLQNGLPTFRDLCSAFKRKFIH